MKTCLTFSALLWSALLVAQTGSISGKIIEAESGFEVIGGTVAVQGTSTGTATDLDGMYLLSGLEAGTYTLECAYLGFETKIIEGVEVTAGEVTTLDIQLGESAIVMDKEIVIEAELILSGENAMLGAQKKSSVVMDGISAEQITKSGDQNAAAAIRRVSGVTVEGGKYVYVRGLGDRYSKTTLNGAEIPGLDPNRNTVQMDLFPSNLLNGIIVYKTFSPNLYGDFSGGYIDVQTKDFPDKMTFNVSANIGYNTLSTFNSETLHRRGSGMDWLAMGANDRAMPTGSRTALDDENYPMYQVSPVDFDIEQGQRLTDISRSFTNEWDFERRAKPMNHRLALSYGNQMKLFGKPLGFLAALTYNRQFTAYQGGEYGIYELTGMYDQVTGLNNQLRLTDDQSEDNVLWGAMLSATYKLTPNNKIGFTAIRNQSGSHTVRYLEGRKFRDDPNDIFQTRTIRYLQRSLTTYQLRGKHILPKLNKMEIAWQSSYAISTQDDPDLRFFTNRINTTTGNIFIKPSSDRIPSRFYRDMRQDNWSNRLDFTLPFKQWNELSSKFQFGAAYGTQQRQFREDRITFQNQNIDYNGNVSSYFDPSNMIEMSSDGAYYANNGTGIYAVNDLDPANNYDASQRVIGGYMMVDMPLTEKLRLITGARLETTQVRLLTFSETALTKYPALDGQTNILDNLDILPSINMYYELTEKMKIRFAYGRTLARPTFRELAPFASFDVEGGYIFIGNPNLQRALVDNFDLRWEVFPNAGEVISVSAFYKNFNNPIERTYNPEQPNGEFTFRNVDNAFLAGAEFEIRKNFGFINESWKNLSFGINASYIYSRTTIDPTELEQIRATNPDVADTREMFGQSPYAVNALLSYKNEGLGLSSNLAFNIIGSRIAYITIGGTPNIYERPRPMLNFNIAKELASGFSLTLSASNLLNASYIETINFKNRDYFVQKRALGVGINLGVRYNFSKAI